MDAAKHPSSIHVSTYRVSDVLNLIQRNISVQWTLDNAKPQTWSKYSEQVIVKCSVPNGTSVPTTPGSWSIAEHGKARMQKQGDRVEHCECCLWDRTRWLHYWTHYSHGYLQKIKPTRSINTTAGSTNWTSGVTRSSVLTCVCLKWEEDMWRTDSWVMWEWGLRVDNSQEALNTCMKISRN